MVLVSMGLTDSPPPSRIRLATGVAGGGYDQYGHKYKQRLQAMGLTVELVNTNGSVDNLQRLVNGEVDVAFAQGGTHSLVPNADEKLRGLAAIYLEPLWVFYVSQKEVLGVTGSEVSSVAAFKGKRISVGPPRSGTEAVSRALLKQHDIDDKNSSIKNLSAKDASKAFVNKELDVAMVVGAYNDAGVKALLEQPGVRLMSFKREIAYSREFPFLTPVKVAEGLLDLRLNIPSQETVLLAPAAMLVCREDLHPRVVEQILKTAQSVHSQGSRLEGPKPFPTLEGVDLPIHEAAETYMKSGESFLSRVLPYWAMRLLVQLKIFILPLIVLWVPAFKLLPALYQWRINSLLTRHYTELREVETHIVHATTPDELRLRVQELDQLHKDMERISRKVPGLYQREVYHWRLHISLVRDEAMDRLQRMQAGKQPEHTLPLGARVG